MQVRELRRSRSKEPAKETTLGPRDGSEVSAVMAAVAAAGLLSDKTVSIRGSVSPALVAAAKRRTGIDTDSDLIRFALALIAIEDPFVDAFRRSHATVDPDLELGF